MRLLLTLAALSLPAWASADHCPRPAAPAKTVIVQQQPASITTIVQIPSYSASYNPDLAAVIERLEKKLDGIEQAIRGQKANDVAAIIGNSCVRCHAEAVAGSKGGGFVMVGKDGRVPPFSLPERRRMKELVNAGRMPPDRPLSEADRKTFEAWLEKKE